VTALAVCHDEDEDRPPWRVISGGTDGRVRWVEEEEESSPFFFLKEISYGFLSPIVQ